jgi:hypothetical protein
VTAAAGNYVIVHTRLLWLVTYIIGHSLLLLRGHQDNEQGRSTTLEILFKNVSATYSAYQEG